MNFNVAPKALKDLDHDLRVNEDILRWVTVKMEPYQRLPRTRKELTELHNALKEAKSYPYPYVPEGYEQEDADMAIGAPFSPETDHGTGSSPQPWR